MEEQLCTVHIDRGKCTGCGRCVAACRKRVLTLEVLGAKKYAVAKDESFCVTSGNCISACPFGALQSNERCLGE